MKRGCRRRCCCSSRRARSSSVVVLGRDKGQAKGELRTCHGVRQIAGKLKQVGGGEVSFGFCSIEIMEHSIAKQWDIRHCLFCGEINIIVTITSDAYYYSYD